MSVVRCLCLLSVVCVCCPVSFNWLLSVEQKLSSLGKSFHPRAISAAMSERVVLGDHLVLDLNLPDIGSELI